MFLREVDIRLTLRHQAHKAIPGGAKEGATNPKHWTGAELHDGGGKEENASNS